MARRCLEIRFNKEVRVEDLRAFEILTRNCSGILLAVLVPPELDRYGERLVHFLIRTDVRDRIMGNKVFK